MDVTILLGSKSDMPVAEKCTKILNHFGVDYQLRVASAHRSPKFVEEIIHKAEEDGCKVFIAMAGLAAALPGAVAALTGRALACCCFCIIFLRTSAMVGSLARASANFASSLVFDDGRAAERAPAFGMDRLEDRLIPASCCGALMVFGTRFAAPLLSMLLICVGFSTRVGELTTPLDMADVVACCSAGFDTE